MYEKNATPKMNSLSMVGVKEQKSIVLYTFSYNTE